MDEQDEWDISGSRNFPKFRRAGGKKTDISGDVSGLLVNLSIWCEWINKI